MRKVHILNNVITFKFNLAVIPLVFPILLMVDKKKIGFKEFISTKPIKPTVGFIMIFSL